MSEKTPVSALEELASKYPDRPEYTYINEDDGSFTCRVELLGLWGNGNARTKREAKQSAANSLLCKWLPNPSPKLSGAEKTPVSALEEFCVKSKNGSPDYSYQKYNDCGFICEVKIFKMEACGYGRSKRDAKHAAAAKIMCKINDQPKSDILPLPILKIEQKTSTTKATNIVSSEKSKETICEISQNSFYEIPVLEMDMELISSRSMIDNIESEENRLLSAYRSITRSGPIDIKKVLICDRHNYFRCFPHPLKTAALKILNADNDATYKSQKDRALSVLSALGLKSQITKVSFTCLDQMIQIELICDFDCVFLGLECEIYSEVLQYFREMLI